ncbi:hypothetical protein FSARC_257 [Fusarium sarcochroum]|uniref:Major facilitator superfamily (MFS) profile domain-containing protein n=1 Tax=Fusarium sarcochroum TaxID=1208366 RepID=A0A8H4UBN5_9HYPO|nr:hypothetical protein FSARC_257 [Fusarium sarcochroum]
MQATSSKNEGEQPRLIVEFDSPQDPSHPHNWSLQKRIWATFMIAWFNLVVSIASSIFGSAQAAVAVEFGLSTEVTILGTSFFLVGYILGPLLFGPLSEKFGRKIPLIVGLVLCGLFSLMPAFGHNIYTVLIGRLFAGFFGVAPIAIVGGCITDCWTATSRGVAMASCISLVFSGPTFGPIIGGFIIDGHLDWRWTMWVVVISCLATALLACLVFPETYPPTILQKKARVMRLQTGDPTIKSALDYEGLSLQHIAQVYLIRPWRLFFTELILVLLTIYQAFIYGMMFLFYQSYPIAFGEVRHWKKSLSSLVLIGIVIGVFVGTGVVILYNQVVYRKKYKRDGGCEPEDRLPPMILGACLVPVGLFWYAWTSAADVPWASQACASLLIGWGMYTIIIQGFLYILDCYSSMANSAMAANGTVRSIFGAAFPLFAPIMYHRLGVAWATSVLGFVSVVMVPVPIVFWYYGSRIRGISKKSPARAIA